MKKKHIETLKEVHPETMYQMLIQCWNEKTPHFNGSGPHRYDGTSQTCKYCNRPKDWKNESPAMIDFDSIFNWED